MYYILHQGKIGHKGVDKFLNLYGGFLLIECPIISLMTDDYKSMMFFKFTEDGIWWDLILNDLGKSKINDLLFRMSIIRKSS